MYCVSLQFINRQPTLRSDIPIYNLEEVSNRDAQVAEKNAIVRELVREEYQAYQRELAQKADDDNKEVPSSVEAPDDRKNKILNWEV